MASISVGSVHVDVVPSVSGFAREMRRSLLPDASRVGDEIGREMASRINEHLDDVRVRVDMGRARQQVAQLNALLDRVDGRRVRVDVDVAVAGSLAELRTLQQLLDRFDGRRVNVRLDVDAAAAIARLLAMQAQMSRLNGQTAHMNADMDIGGALASIASLRAALGGLALLANPQIAAVGAGLVGLIGPLTAAGVGFAGMGAVAIPAISRIKEAQQQQTQAVAQGASAAAQGQSRAYAMAAAQQQLASAIRNSAETHRQALQRVKDAEEQLAGSQRDARRAQEELNRARFQAARDLQDMANDVADARLAERRAVFGVQDAEADLAKLRKDPKATDEQIARQRLAVDEAKQQLSEQQLALRRIVADEAAARKAGVEGSDQVRSARDRLTEANRRIEQSERAVAAARAGVAVAERQAADQIASARRAVAQASMQAAGASTSLGRSLIQLTPLEQAVAAAWESLTGAFNEWARALQPEVLPLLIKGMGILRSLLPGLTPIVISTARAVDGLLDRLAAGLASPFWREFAADLAKWAGPAVTALGQIVGNLLTAFAGIARAFAPIGFAMLDLLTRITGAFANFAAGLVNSAGFKQFATQMITVLDGMAAGFSQLMPLVAPILGDLLKLLFNLGLVSQQIFRSVLAAVLPTVGAIVGALSQALTAIMPVIVGVLPMLTPVLSAIGVAVGQVVTALAAAVEEAAPALQQLVTSVVSLIPALLPLVTLWARWLTTIIPLIPAVLSIAATIATVLAPVLRFVIGVVVGLWTVFANLILPVFRLAVAAVTWLASVLQPAFSAIGAAATWLWTNAIQPAFELIGKLARWLYSIVAVAVLLPLIVVIKVVAGVVTWLWKSVFAPAWSGIVKAHRQAWANIQPIVKALGAGIRWVWNTFIKPVFDGIRLALDKLAPHFKTAVDAISRAWNRLKSEARKPVQYVVDVVFNKGIVKIWNAVAGMVPGVNKLQPIAFARGGIMPGYAPGRDKLLAAVSPGESIFRPEFTRAVGEDFVTGANSAARSGGVSGVMRFLGLAGDPGMGPGFAGHFALGGVVGGFLKAAKNWFAGGLVKTATAAFNPLISTAQKAVGGTAFGDLAVGAARGLVGKILGYFKPLESKLGGNAVVQAARTQLGVPYVWGGTRWNVGLDCSGLTSQAWLRGAHKWIGRTTYAQYPASSPIDAPRPAALGFPHMGHVVLASRPGHIIEAPYTGANVREVPISRHYEWRWPNAAAGLKFDSGGWLPTGTSLVYNGTGAPEPVFTNGQLAGLMDGSSGGETHYHAHLDGMTKAAYEQQVRSAFTAMQVEQGRRDRTGRRR